MANGLPTGDYAELLPLSVACARVYFVLTECGPQLMASAHLDDVAYSLLVVASIYATDTRTNILFPVSKTELVRGKFQGGAKVFVHEGNERYTGLHIALADLEDAIRILVTATTQSLPDPLPTRP